MRQVKIFCHDDLAGILTENDDGHYHFAYMPEYQGAPISLTFPTSQKEYSFDSFPAYFDGLLPEGLQLEALLKQAKLDRTDYLGQLTTIGRDLVGAVTVEK